MARAAALLAALAFTSAALHTQSLQPYDIVLRGGTIYDGTGAAPFRADVGVRRGYIAAVGDLSRDRGAVDLDVRGLYVAPGFVNIHSHPIGDGLTRAENMLTQGVTTEILNPDGSGPLNIQDQLARVSGAGLAVNAGAYIGFNSAWSNVVGAQNRRPTPDEIERMRQLLLDGLAAGAWGVSSGLDYKPAYYAQVEDVIRIVSVAAPWRTNFTNHDRVTPESNFSSRAGIAETLAIAAKAGLVPVVTHMKATGNEKGTAPAILRMMQQGRYAAADAYPYLAGQTGLGALIIPAWAQEGGREEMLKRIADPAVRSRVVAEAEQAMQARFGGPQSVSVTTIDRRLTDVMDEMKVSAGEAILRLLETREMGAVLHFGLESDLVAILKHPTTSIACDCGATAGPATHPRYYGSFPRVLGRYVRERKALTWEDAIRKMTGLPAATIGLIDRGLLAPGMAADITVFDPATVIDHATFEKPTERSEGIRHVIVNGRLALEDGEPTDERAGRALVRRNYMPSRPFTDGTRRAVAKGTVSGVHVTLDVRQGPSNRRASGSFRFKDDASSSGFESIGLGHLQVADDWASFTAWGRSEPSGEERAVTVVIDRANPAAPASSTLMIEADGDVLYAAPVQGQVNLSMKR